MEKLYQKNCCLSKQSAKTIAGRLNVSAESVTLWFMYRNAHEKRKQFPAHSCSFCKGNHQYLSHSKAIGTKICKKIHITEEYNSTCCARAVFVKIITCMQNSNACYLNAYSLLMSVSTCMYQIYLKVRLIFLWSDDE